MMDKETYGAMFNQTSLITIKKTKILAKSYYMSRNSENTAKINREKSKKSREKSKKTVFLDVLTDRYDYNDLHHTSAYRINHS